MSLRVVVASEANVPLDSNVYTGGGTDSTEALQAILDTAPQVGHLHLILDGAALVRGLRVHSNTTIECPSSDCGLYLADGSNRALISNANWDFENIRDHDIKLIGGTYNHNCAGQQHHVPVPDDDPGLPLLCPEWLACFGNTRAVIAMEFYGVRRLSLRDVTIRDQRTYAFSTANWEQVTMENIRIDLPGRMHAQNQDGLHFYGPGRFLSLKNISGRSGDDFIALAPDENDLKSSITDVLIDGVFLDDADQGIRLLSRADGRLDRVTIRNVTGTYRSFGFYINPWFYGTGYGHYGCIRFENIDLRQTKPNYDYTTPFLFRVGGRVENLVFKDVTLHHPSDGRPAFELGWPFDSNDATSGPGVPPPQMTSVLIDGLRVVEDDTGADCYMRVRCPIKHMTVRNVEVVRENNGQRQGCLLQVQEGGDIGTLQLYNVDLPASVAKVENAGGKIERLKTDSD